jgi:peroxiredoxin Q/BCP
MSPRDTDRRRNNRRPPRGATGNRRFGPRALVLGALALGLLVVGIAAYNTLVGSDHAAARYDIGKPGPGDLAPDFTLPAADGSTFHLADYRGKQVLLYFHEGLGCAPCWQQLDAIQADLARFNGLHVDQIAAISADPAGAQAQRAQRTGIRLPTLADTDRSVSVAYGTLAYGMMNGQLPGHTFILVGPDGSIRWRADYGGPPNYTMYVADDTLLAELRRVLGVSE